MRTLTFATALAELRTRTGLSQTRLALEAGLDHSCVSRLEAGQRNPSPATILLLAETLGVAEAERDQLLIAAGFVPRGIGRLTLALQALAEIEQGGPRLFLAGDAAQARVRIQRLMAALHAGGAS